MGEATSDGSERLHRQPNLALGVADQGKVRGGNASGALSALAVLC